MHQNQALFSVAALAVLALPLSGCGGGGGGSKPDPAPAVVSTTPPVVAAPPADIAGTLQLNGGVSTGLATTATYTYVVGANADTITGGTGAVAATVSVSPTSGAITGVHSSNALVITLGAL